MPSNPYYEQDVEKAKEIVKELQAEGTTLTLVTNTNEGLKKYGPGDPAAA